jgi:hypothetical protein
VTDPARPFGSPRAHRVASLSDAEAEARRGEAPDVMLPDFRSHPAFAAWKDLLLDAYPRAPDGSAEIERERMNVRFAAALVHGYADAVS